MSLRTVFLLPLCLTLLACSSELFAADGSAQKSRLTITWENNLLKVYGDYLPGGELEVWYLEAYCKDGSTDREWGKTLIKHKTELISASKDKK